MALALASRSRSEPGFLADLHAGSHRRNGSVRQEPNSSKLFVSVDAGQLTGIALVINALGSFIAAAAAGYAAIISTRNSFHLQRIEHATNSMKDELVNATRKGAFAEGLKQGQEEPRSVSST
jgi:hypothetical protein